MTLPAYMRELIDARAEIEQMKALLTKARKPIWQWAPDSKATDQLLHDIDAALEPKP